jgi:adenylate cyclase
MPMMRVGTQRRVALLLRALGAGVLIGAVFGGTTGSGFNDAPRLGAMLGVVAGVINGVTITGVIFGAEIFLSPTRFGHALERVPFLLTLAMKVLVYGIVITLVVGGGLGWRVVVIAPMLLSPDLAAAISEHIKNPVAPRMVRTFFLVGLAIFVLQLSRLVGERTLRDIVFGRYHRSRTEERFFLFVDIIGSTPLAERIGPGAVHRFLGEVFRLASDPIDDERGEVYQYVGDEIVITWTVTEGRDGARPLACFFAIEQALARAAPQFEREFNAVPRLRAALHAGPVVTGEVGGSRRAIVYHGDVMNTTSRIEQATRDLERQFLVSGDALQRLADLEGFERENLGLQQLRGRAAAMQIYAVTAKPSTNEQKAI